ncbi:type I secretion system [Vibrio ponticus]|nr:type I secretion system [Vibrio ponticus]
MRITTTILVGGLLASNYLNAQTLEQAVAITLKNNPEIKQSYNEYQSAVKEHDAAGGAYLPSIDLDAVSVTKALSLPIRPDETIQT